MEPGDESQGQARKLTVENVTLDDGIETLRVIEGRDEEVVNEQDREETKTDDDDDDDEYLKDFAKFLKDYKEITDDDDENNDDVKFLKNYEETADDDGKYLEDYAKFLKDYEEKTDEFLKDHEEKADGGKFLKDHEEKADDGKFLADAEEKADGGKFLADAEEKADDEKFLADAEEKADGGKFLADAEEKADGGKFLADAEEKADEGKFLADAEEKTDDGDDETFLEDPEEKMDDNEKPYEEAKSADDEKPQQKEADVINAAKEAYSIGSDVVETTSTDAKTQAQSASDETTSGDREVDDDDNANSIERGEAKAANDEKPTGNPEDKDACGERIKPFDINALFRRTINQEELMEAERETHPREYNLHTTLVAIGDKEFDKLMSRDFNVNLPTEVLDFINDTKVFMNSMRKKMVSLRKENKITMSFLREEFLEGNDQMHKELLIHLIMNRQKISKLEILNAELTEEKQAYSKELSRIKDMGSSQPDIYTVEDPQQEVVGADGFMEAGNSVAQLYPLPKNRHLVPGNFIDCYDDDGVPLPVGKLTHILKRIATAGGQDIWVEKVESGSPVSMDEDEDESSGEGEVEVKKEEVQEVCQEINTREVPVKKQRKCISDQKPADMCKIRAGVSAKFAQKKDPQQKVTRSNTTGVHLPPLNSRANLATTPPRFQKSDPKPVKPSKKLLKKGLDCIKPNTELVYLGSMPLTSANSVVPADQILPRRVQPEPKKARPPSSKKTSSRAQRPPSSKMVRHVESGKITPWLRKNIRIEESPLEENPEMSDRPQSGNGTHLPPMKSETTGTPIRSDKKMPRNVLPKVNPSKANISESQEIYRRSDVDPIQVPSGLHLPRLPDSLVGKPSHLVQGKSDVVLAKKPRPPSGRPTSRTVKGRASVSGGVLMNATALAACLSGRRKDGGSRVSRSRHVLTPVREGSTTPGENGMELDGRRRAPSVKSMRSRDVLTPLAEGSITPVENDKELDGRRRAPSVKGMRSRDVLTPLVEGGTTPVENDKALDGRRRAPSVKGMSSRDVLTPLAEGRTTPVEGISRTVVLDASPFSPAMNKTISDSTQIEKGQAYPEGTGKENGLTLPKIIGAAPLVNHTSPGRPSQASRMAIIKNGSILPNRLKSPSPNNRRIILNRSPRATPSPEAGTSSIKKHHPDKT